MTTWKVGYRNEHPWDASLDSVGEVEVEAQSKDEAETKFREDYPSSPIDYLYEVK